MLNILSPTEIDATEVEVQDAYFEFSFEDYSSEGTGIFWLQLLPRPRVEMRAILQDVPDYLQIKMSLLERSPKIKINGVPATGFFHYKQAGTSIALKFEPSSEPFLLERKDHSEIKTIQARLFSFPDFIQGNSDHFEHRDSQSTRISALTLHNTDCVINITSFFDSKNRFLRLRESGRHQQTHGVLIEANSKFTAETANKLIEDLSVFLSFTCGNYVRFCCAVGAQKDTEVVWSYHNSPSIDVRQTISWFDKHTATQISELYPLWFERMKNEGWRTCLTETVRLYIMANDPSKGVEGPIVIAQTAIERISFEYFVNDKMMLNREGFMKLPASERMRLLVASMQAPINLDSLPTSLASLGKANNWKDLLQGLAATRNSIVHPEIKDRDKYSDAKTDAWNYSLWLLELAILWSLKYLGTYSNRTKQRFTGQVESVPWLTESNPSVSSREHR